MFKLKIFFSILIFSFFLIGTSIIKNKTRQLEKNIDIISEKIHLKEKDLNESQLDFSYLVSPSIIEQKINHLDNEEYLIMNYSNIFLSFSGFLNINNKVAFQEGKNEKKIKKK